MTLRLTVRRPAWRSHIARFARSVDGLVPVVKGNGYGFGRATLLPIAQELADHVGVGTVHELDDGVDAAQVVLTPAAAPPNRADVILTVGAPLDCERLSGWGGRVMIKLQSSMRRYGCTPSELPTLLKAAAANGLTPVAYALHLPLAGDDERRLREVAEWLEHLDGIPLWVSHLSPPAFADLQAANAGRQFRLRVGTALWHGDKSSLQLRADVTHTASVRSGDHAGYHLTAVPGDGAVTLIGAGSAHGVAPLTGADGTSLSPFHFNRTRLALLEPPHMHTSMAFVPAASTGPRVGDWVDVQRPLISTLVDELRWMD
jgi:alanine racemase